MRVIDSQVHAYERDHPGRPWAARLPGPPEVTGPILTAAMDVAGVDAAILVSTWTLYGYDASYAISVREGCPERFALINPIDTSNRAAAAAVAAWDQVPGRVGIRIMPLDGPQPGLDPALEAATRLGLAVNLAFTNERLADVERIARAHPDCQLVVDHLGLRPPLAPPVPDDPFRYLPQVIDLAHHANVAIKVSGVCTLSQQGPPFADIWEPLLRVIDAFGVDRCMWGSDWTRALDFVSYEEAVSTFLDSPRLGQTDREALMGRTLQRVYRWVPGA